MSKGKAGIWLPSLAVMLLIFMLSSQPYEQQSIKQPLSQWVDQIPLTYHLSEVTIRYGTLTIDGGKQGPEAVLEFLLRKTAHVLEYGLLGGFIAFALMRRERLPFAAAALTAVLACMGVAFIDEFNQQFVKERGARIQDVWLDTAGAGAGVLLYGGIRNIKAFARSRSSSRKGGLK